MVVYLGFQSFKRHSGEVRFFETGRVGVSGILIVNYWSHGRPYTYEISVLERQTREEKAKTIIHELLHIGLEGELVRCHNLSPEYIAKLPELERKIEDLTEEIYSCQPRFVEHIMNRFLRVD